ncbi:MAG: hypothetical protein AAGB48_01825 [Planctomycetota bacterium]
MTVRRLILSAVGLAAAASAAGQAVSPIEPSDSPRRDRQPQAQQQAQPQAQPGDPAQPSPADGPRIPRARPITVSVDLGAYYDAVGEGDGAVGEVRTLRLPASATIQIPLNQRNFFSFSVDQTSSFYDFENFTGFSNFAPQDPLDYGLESNVGVSLLHIYDQKWAFFGSISAGFAGELGADFQDGLTYGGNASARYQLNQDVAIGLGVTFRTRIEEDPFVFPAPSLDVQATDYTSFHLGVVDGGPGAPTIGLRVENDAFEDVTLGAFFGVRFHQFRLAEDNDIASAGILEDFILPLGGFARFELSENVDLTATASFIPHRELKLQNSNGVDINDIELHPSASIGVGVEIAI